MLVKNVMSRDVEVCHPETNLAHAAALMFKSDCGFLPVTDQGQLVGVVTDRDLCMASATQGEVAASIPVEVAMSRDFVVCAPGDDVREVLGRMAKHQVRRLPVTKGGVLKGVVSINDLVVAAKSKRGKDDAPNYADVVRTLREIGRPRSREASI